MRRVPNSTAAPGRGASRRFVVTGCAGFVGSHLAAALLGEGHAVVGVDAFTDYYARERKEANVAALRGHPRFELVETDVAHAPLPALFEGAAGIYHLAAQPGVRASWGESFAEYVRRNVLATQAVFEAAVAVGVRAVFASSSSVYGNAEGTRESTTPCPVSPYGVTKSACEQRRYFAVYGPRQRPDNAFSRLLGGGTFTVFGSGRQSRVFTFVSDAVAARVASMARAPAGAVYNVGGGEEASIREMIELSQEIAGRTLDVVYADGAAGDVVRTAADTALICGELGWQPSVAARGRAPSADRARAERTRGGVLSAVRRLVSGPPPTEMPRDSQHNVDRKNRRIYFEVERRCGVAPSLVGERTT